MNKREWVSHKLIREACDELGIEIKKLSYDWILQLKKDNKIRYITGTLFDLNTQASAKIATDKYATYEVLKNSGVPVIKYKMLFNPVRRADYIEEKNIWKFVETELSKYGSIVVKPNRGCEGIGVQLCRTLDQAKTAIKDLFETESAVTISPYYDIKNEYRTIFLDGRIYLIYYKTKPFVIGDGILTLGELVNKLNLSNKRIIQENLQQLDLKYVPKENEKVEISWKHNLSGGAKPTILQEGEIYNKIEELAIIAGKAMNIKFASIDIIQTNDDKFYVIEVNSGIATAQFIKNTTDGDKIIKKIYIKALKEMFK